MLNGSACLSEVQWGPVRSSHPALQANRKRSRFHCVEKSSTVVLQPPDCVLWRWRREGMWASSEPTWCMIHKSKGCCCCCWSRACPDPLLMQHICINTNYTQSNSNEGECRSTFITWSDNRPSSPVFHLLFAIIGRWKFQRLSFCEIKFHKAFCGSLSTGRKVAELKMELNSYVNDTTPHLDWIFYHDYGAMGLRLHTEEQSCHHKVKEHKDSVNRQLSILDDVLHQYCESSCKPGQLLLMSCHRSFCSRNPKWRYGSFLMLPCIRLSEIHLIKRNKDQIGHFCPSSCSK